MRTEGIEAASRPHLSRTPDAAVVRGQHRTADWKEDGWCYGQNDDTMYPDDHRAQRKVAQYCQVLCEVRTTCLQYALDADERYGVWGGLTEREREKLRKGSRP